MIWGFESRQRLGIFLFTTAFRPSLGPTQPLIQSIPGIKRWREADCSPPFSADVKYAWSYTSTPSIRLHDVILKHRDSLTFTFPYTCDACQYQRQCGLVLKSWYSDWAMGWTIGVLGFDSRRGLEIFLFTTASRMALRPNQPPIQGVPGALSLGVKRPGREADNSPSSSAKVKNEWSYTSTSSTRLHGVVLS
jgi:hypothetical protein